MQRNNTMMKTTFSVISITLSILGAFSSTTGGFQCQRPPRRGITQESTPPLIRQVEVETEPRIAETYLESRSSLNSTLPLFLLGSNMIYGYANLRKIVMEHDSSTRAGIPVKEKDIFRREKEKLLVGFYRPQLIVTQEGNQKRDRYLKYDITVPAILEFLENNRKYPKDKKGRVVLDERGKNTIPTEFERRLKSLVNLNVKITEFDDEFSSGELVYGIAVDETERRISVFFRGSVFGGKDWQTNLNGFYANVKTPTRSILANVTTKKGLKIHQGFYSYLHAPGKEEVTPTKFETIVKNLKEVVAENPGFEIFISGHSLGGALCQLLAFELAAYTENNRQSDPFPLPIRAVSFASPQVGNKGYAERFEALEKAGRLRHVRVSNQGDLVPTVPSGAGYTQTGINLHLNVGKRMTVCYPSQHIWFSQLRPYSVSRHSLESYACHLLFPENSDILQKTADQLYDEYH